MNGKKGFGRRYLGKKPPKEEGIERKWEDKPVESLTWGKGSLECSYMYIEKIISQVLRTSSVLQLDEYSFSALLIGKCVG
jgi:hypothetical protein